MFFEYKRRMRDTIRTTFIILIAILCKSMPGASDVRSSCRIVPGLTKEQLALCYRATDVTRAALDGLDLAIRECQSQFQWQRWNCSSLNARRRNPHTSNLLRKGYKESAFAYAISAAGVAHSIAKACSQGRLISCGCDPYINRRDLIKSLRSGSNSNSIDSLIDKRHFLQSLDDNRIEEHKLARLKTTSRWKWGGCSHNMNFGIEFSKLFLDARERTGDIQSKINLHNNHVGRMAVANNMQIRCKCHGMSGSCSLKTCWKSAPEFRIVGKVLKHTFRNAILVDQSNMGNGEPIIIRSNRLGYGRHHNNNNVRPPRKTLNKHRSKKSLENSLFYYQRSPTFCDRDPAADIQGTIGRKCNRTSTGSGSCSSMCCGRGYNMVKERRIEKCNCKFHWCCQVECQECHTEEWISVCK